TPTRCRRSSSRRWRGSRSLCTRRARASRTSITRRCATTWVRAPARARVDRNWIVRYRTNMPFGHADHLILAIESLREEPSFDAAIARVESTLRSKAVAAGVPEKYHHTVTVFWMKMAAQLLDKDLPFAYYSRERLESEEARRGWVEPDRQPLPAAGGRCL